MMRSKADARPVLATDGRAATADNEAGGFTANIHHSRSHTAPPRRLTWQELVELEPGLDALLRQVQAAPKRMSTIDLWYGRRGWGFKNQLEHLVGWGRRQEHPVLSSSRAYNVAYQHLYSALERRGGGAR